MEFRRVLCRSGLLVEKDNVIRMLCEFWPDIFVILLVCSLVSFANQKFGIFVATPITLGSTALTLLLGAAGATRFYSYLPFGLGLFQQLRGSDFSPVAILEERA